MHVMLPLRNVVLGAQIWKTAFLGSHPSFATDVAISKVFSFSKTIYKLG